jgi:type I restriction enzyme S subunit
LVASIATSAINDNLVATGVSSIQKNVGNGVLINLTEIEMDSVVIPEGFMVKTMAEFCADTKSGSTPSRTNNDFWENGTIPWVKSGEVHNNITLKTEEHITPNGLNGSSTKLLPKDTVLMAMYGVTAGEVGYLAIEATTNQAICGMICHSRAEAAYLYFSLIQSQAAISRLSNGGAQDNLSKNFIDGIKVVVPPANFIDDLRLSAVVDYMAMNTKEIAALTELQSTILAQLSSR